MNTLTTKPFILIMTLFGLSTACLAVSATATAPAWADVTVTASEDTEEEPGLEEDTRVDSDTCDDVGDAETRVSRC